MILKIFSIYDSKAEAYLPPFYMKTVGQAIRAFTETCADPQHQFHRYPEDFTIFSLGEFDDESATFHLPKTPLPIGKAIEFISKAPNVGNGVLTPRPQQIDIEELTQ